MYATWMTLDLRKPMRQTRAAKTSTSFGVGEAVVPNLLPAKNEKYLSRRKVGSPSRYGKTRTKDERRLKATNG